MRSRFKKNRSCIKEALSKCISALPSDVGIPGTKVTLTTTVYNSEGHLVGNVIVDIKVA